MKNKVISIIVLLAFVMMGGSGCRLFHHKKKHRGDGMVGDFSMPFPENKKPPKDDGKPKATKPPENKSPDGKPSDEYPAEKYVVFGVKDAEGVKFVYKCNCKYTGSKEVKEPSDWEYVEQEGPDNKHFWTGHASLGDGYECTVQHFRDDLIDMPATELPKPFLSSPPIIKSTYWIDEKEGFDYHFECGPNQEIKIVEPDWKLDSNDNTWKAETWFGDGWACNCNAKPIKADNK